MVGPLEIAIIAVIALLILGYRYADRLPGLGRRGGEGVRELKDSVQDAVGDKADPKTLGQKAGQGLREAREFRDALTGKAEPQRSEAPPAQEPTAEPRDGERDKG
jgi:Sec-independent protein translocase protein TatA